jgi:D-aminoacyl-tRNA deacylase
VTAAVRLVIQRVSRGTVHVGGRVSGQIGPGLVVLVGVGRHDGRETAAKAAERTWSLRLFPPDWPATVADRPEQSARDLGLPVLAVSQFTLLADTSRGRRPSYVSAAPPEDAEPLFEAYCEKLESLGARVERGVFGAHMEVEVVNDGPVTIVMDV